MRRKLNVLGMHHSRPCTYSLSAMKCISCTFTDSSYLFDDSSVNRQSQRPANWSIVQESEWEDPMAKQHAPRFLGIVSDAKSRISECAVADVHAMQAAGEEFNLVDVREESEFASGHLPRAIHLGKGVIERDIEKSIPETSAKIILYCGGGFRSALAADALQKMGYTNVISMDGGWSGWKAAGYETEANG